MIESKHGYKYSDITGKIIGCAMKVHNTLGNGFQEVIYQRCLAIEMEMPILYEDIEVGTRSVDFLVEGKVLVELKAVHQLDNIHLAQGLNYLEAFNLEIGLLLNFGSTKLEFKRLINEEKVKKK